MTPAEREALGNTGPWLEVIFTRSGKDGSSKFYPACGGATYSKDQLEGVDKIEFIRLQDDVFAGLLKQFRQRLKEKQDLISSLELTLYNATNAGVLQAQRINKLEAALLAINEYFDLSHAMHAQHIREIQQLLPTHSPVPNVKTFHVQAPDVNPEVD